MIAFLPRYAPAFARLAAAGESGGALPLRAPVTGFTRKRALPRWRSDIWRDANFAPKAARARVVLFVDTFNRYFEPENARAAHPRAAGGGYRVNRCSPARRAAALLRRTFLSAGLAEEAKRGTTPDRSRAARSSSAACRSSAWSRPARSRCATNWLRCCPAKSRGLRRILLFEEFVCASRTRDAGTCR
jgi:hypothetical protein